MSYSDEKLKQLLSGKAQAQETSTWGFTALNGSGTYTGEQLFSYNPDVYGNYTFGWNPSKPKIYSMGEKQELRGFLGSFLVNSLGNAHAQVKDYNSEIGVISLKNGINNVRWLFGGETTHDVEARLKDELKNAQKLNEAVEHQGAFDSRFERFYGMEFNPAKVDKLQAKSVEYMKMSAFNDKVTQLQEGLKHVKTVYAREMALNDARARGQIVPPSKDNFKAEFIKVLDKFCNGNTELRNQFIQNISEGITNEKELNEKFMTCLQNLEIGAKEGLKTALGGKTFEQHQEEYNALCKDALGTEVPDVYVKNYIESTKQIELWTEIGLTIATAFATGGSSLIKNAGEKLAARFGAQVAGHIMKAGMTFGVGSIPATLSTVDAVTSEKGLTPDKRSEIFSKWKTGMFYGALGAYISGPIGDMVANLIKTKPSAITNCVRQAFSEKTLNRGAMTTGKLTETSVDVMFDMITQNMDLMSSFKQNGGMNFGMMIAGGMLSKYLHRAKVSGQDMPKILKMDDGSYRIEDSKKNVIFEAPNEDALVTFMLVAAAKTESNHKMAAGKTVDEILLEVMETNPGETTSKALADKVGLRVDTENLGKDNPIGPRKVTPLSPDFINVLKHLDPEVMAKRYENMRGVLVEIVQKRITDINKINETFATDRQKATEDFVKLLSEELGIGEITPPVQYRDLGESDGCFDFSEGTILLNSNIVDSEGMIQVIAHELIHVIQFKDVLASGGGTEAIIRNHTKNEIFREDVINNLKEEYTKEEFEQLTPEEIEKIIYEEAVECDYIKETLAQPYIQKLIAYAEKNPIQKGSLNDYMARIYDDNFANSFGSNDIDNYITQMHEKEAYYLGTNAIAGTIFDEIPSFEPSIYRGDDVVGKADATGFPEAKRVVKEDGSISQNAFAVDNNITAHYLKIYIEKGKIIANPDGTINPNNPQNKSFLEELNSPSLVTREDFAQRVGIVPDRLSGFVRDNSITQHISGKYDMNLPENAYFLDNYKKGQKFVPYHNAILGVPLDAVKPSDPTTTPPKVNEEPTQQKPTSQSEPSAVDVEVDPNKVNVKQYALMVGLTPDAVLYHVNFGRINYPEGGKIDLSVSENRKFLEDFAIEAENKYSKMTSEELLAERDAMKENIRSLIGRQSYIVASEALKISDEQFQSYIDYTTRQFINTEGMSNAQVAELKKVFSEIISERINDNQKPTDFSDVEFFKPKMPVEIPVYQKLLENLTNPPKDVNTTSTVKNPDGSFDVTIKAGTELENLFKTIEENSADKIKFIKAIQSGNISMETLIEKFLYNKYTSMKNNPARQFELEEIMSKKIKRNAFANVFDMKLDIIIEKILYNDRKITPNSPDYAAFQEFKTRYKLDEMVSVINAIQDRYIKDFYNDFLVPDGLNLLRKANPKYEVDSSHLIELFNQRTGITSETPVSLTKHLAVAKYHDAIGVKPKRELEIKEYIEVFHTPEHVGIYNQLVEIYNKFCGARRDPEISQELLDKLKTTSGGVFDKQRVRSNIRIIYDIINEFNNRPAKEGTDKVNPSKSTPKEEVPEETSTTENSSTKDTSTETVPEEVTPEGTGPEEVTPPEIKELNDYIRNNSYIMNEINYEVMSEFPIQGAVSQENLLKARLLSDIIEKYTANDDINLDALQATFSNLNGLAKGKADIFAEFYSNMRVEERARAIEKLLDEDGSKSLADELSFYEKHKMSISNKTNLQPYEYVTLRSRYHLSDNQIFDDQTNILEVLGAQDMNSLGTTLQRLYSQDYNGELKALYKMFGQHNITDLKNYLETNKITSYRTKYSGVKRLSFNTAKDGKTTKKYDQCCNIELNYKNRNESIVENLNHLVDVFENVNKEISLSSSTQSLDNIGTYGSLINEIKRCNEIAKDKSGRFEDMYEYSSILQELGIDSKRLTKSEIYWELDRLDDEQKAKLNKIVEFVNDVNFGGAIVSVHAKMRFFERFILKDKVDYTNKSEYRAYVDDFVKSVNESINRGVTLEPYNPFKNPEVVVARFTVPFRNHKCTITLNHDKKIHTLF